MSKLYEISCNQGTPLSSWNELYNEQELIEKFKDYAENDGHEEIPDEEFTLDYIQEVWDITLTEADVNKRLEYLRGEIKAERIGYSEIVELQSLAEYIKPDDVELLQWAGVPETN